MKKEAESRDGLADSLAENIMAVQNVTGKQVRTVTMEIPANFAPGDKLVAIVTSDDDPPLNCGGFTENLKGVRE